MAEPSAVATRRALGRRRARRPALARRPRRAGRRDRPAPHHRRSVRRRAPQRLDHEHRCRRVRRSRGHLVAGVDPPPRPARRQPRPRERRPGAAVTSALPVPVDVADVTADWLSGVLGIDIGATEVLDVHSGTTGRVRLALTYGGGVDGECPPSVFVKLPPFKEKQRRFVAGTGLRTAPARLYRGGAAAGPMRGPPPAYAALRGGDGDILVLG